ncbi:hypothetical protein NE237_011106 [Protea cynaroides]|uniref:Uncharacterized protein n=1 Tax=Protea cynaroides TaxID=273540 RepID=A0A9Q0GXA1_9MAGN|nr:hypothetical protein NE237_011106 [Protea cynaroides]
MSQTTLFPTQVLPFAAGALNSLSAADDLNSLIPPISIISAAATVISVRNSQTYWRIGSGEQGYRVLVTQGRITYAQAFRVKGKETRRSISEWVNRELHRK